MRYVAAFFLLIFAVSATVTADLPDGVSLLPTETVPFLAAWQQEDEFVAMGGPSCEKASSLGDDRTPLNTREQDCLAARPLQRRQSSTECPSSYSNCYGQGAPGLCCQPSAVCSADMAGNVACCPVGAACTGTISAVNTATQTSTSNYGASTSTTTNPNAFSSLASTSTAGPAATTSGGFIITASDASLTLQTSPGIQFARVVSSASKAIWAMMRGTRT